MITILQHVESYGDMHIKIQLNRAHMHGRGFHRSKRKQNSTLSKKRKYFKFEIGYFKKILLNRIHVIIWY